MRHREFGSPALHLTGQGVGHPLGSVHRHGDGHGVGPVDELWVDSLDGNIYGSRLVPGVGQGSQGRGEMDRLASQFVGGDEQELQGKERLSAIQWNSVG